MNVDVRDCLSCGFIDIDADVEAVWFMPLGDFLAGDLNATKKRFFLRLSRFEPGGNVAPRYYQGMALCDCKCVPQTPNDIVFIENTILVWFVKWTFGGHVIDGLLKRWQITGICKVNASHGSTGLNIICLREVVRSY